MRLSPGEYPPKVDNQQVLTFYTGKNTPERKDYIMKNLVVSAEKERWRETPNPKQASNSKIRVQQIAGGDFAPDRVRYQFRRALLYSILNWF